MKFYVSLKTSEVEKQAERRLRTLLAEIPGLAIVDGPNDLHPPERDLDFALSIEFHDARYVLFCEVKSSGQPRHVRAAAHQILHTCQRSFPVTEGAIPVVIAPYLSPAARTLCLELNVCYMDFEGNCRLQFGGVYIDHKGTPKPKSEKRELQKVFSPKSEQVLRRLVREPHRAWRLADLAQASNVSIGHVSNVKTALIDNEWAEVEEDGLRLANIGKLLDAWRAAYDGLKGRRLSFHTILHGSSLKEKLPEALALANDEGSAMLASLSAASWLAAYARAPTEFFYANAAGLDVLKKHLILREVEQGGNVVVTIPDDDDLFLDAYEPFPGIACTSPVQTYLDLTLQGSRGEEAADHLRQILLDWAS